MATTNEAQEVANTLRTVTHDRDRWEELAKQYQRERDAAVDALNRALAEKREPKATVRP